MDQLRPFFRLPDVSENAQTIPGDIPFKALLTFEDKKLKQKEHRKSLPQKACVTAQNILSGFLVVVGVGGSEGEGGSDLEYLVPRAI